MKPSGPHCPQCGAALAPDAPQGLCPACLVQAGLSPATLASQPDAEATLDSSQSKPASSGSQLKFNAPSTSLGLPQSIRYFGDYELESEIARGGMGVVYRARQVSLSRTVALKMILAGQFVGETEVQRFRAEAEAAANLNHPNIVPIYEIGLHEGRHYFSMKLVEGGSLAEKMRNAECGTRSADDFPRTERVALLAQVARAVHHAHQRGVLHRDLKPGNILLDEHGEPFVTDFGLAKRLDGQSDLTHTGATMGTPAYMAPEQAAGRVKEFSTALDVYALGAILFHLLTGRVPFTADTPLATMKLVMEQEAPSPRTLDATIDRDLETICLKCLEKDPKRRYGSAEALAEELDRWLRHEPIAARPITNGERVVKWVRRKPAIAALGAAAAAAVVLGITGVFWQWREAEAARDVAQKQSKAEGAARLQAQQAQKAEAKAREEISVARDRVADLLSLSQAEQGVRLLETGDPSGLLHLVKARETVEHLPTARMSRTRVWAHWLDQFERKEPEVVPDGGHSLTLSSDGKLLAVGGTSNGVVILDAATLHIRHQFKAGGPNNRIAFASHANEVAIEDFPRTADFFDFTTGLPVKLTKRASGIWPPPSSGGKDSPIVWPGVAREWELRTVRPGGKVQLYQRRDERPVGKPVEMRLSYRLEALAVSPDERVLAVVEGKLRLFDLITGAQIGGTLGEFERESLASGVAFAPDGKSLIEYDGRFSKGGIKVWNVPEGTLRGELARKDGWIGEPRLSQSRKLAATSPTAGNELRVLEVTTGKVIAHAFRHNNTIGSVAFSHDDRWIAVGSRSGAEESFVRVWNISTGEPLGHPISARSMIHTMLFHPDGKRLLVLERDELRVWPLSSGSNSEVPVREWKEGGLALFSPKGDLLVADSESSEGMLHCFPPDVSSNTPPRWSGPGALPVTFSRDGGTLAAIFEIGADGKGTTFGFMAVGTGQAVGQKVRAAGLALPSALSDDGRQFATIVHAGPRRGDGAGDIEVFDVRTGNSVRRIKIKPMQASWAQLAFSPDGKKLGAQLGFGYWFISDLESGRPLTSLESDSAEFTTVLAPDWRWAVSHSPNGRSASTNVAGITNLPMADAVASMLFPVVTRDGRYVAGYRRGESAIRVIEAATGRMHRRPLQMSDDRSSVEFGPTGEWLLTRSETGVFRRWDFTSLLPLGPAQEQTKPKAGGGEETSTAWSPDGRLRVTYGDGQPTRLLREPDLEIPLEAMKSRTWRVTGFDLDENGARQPIPQSPVQTPEDREQSGDGPRPPAQPSTRP